MALSLLGYRAEWESKAPLPELDWERPFTYLAKGNQSYVFENGDFVLKLFRYTRTRFASLQKIKNWIRKREKAHLFQKLNKTFGAARLAESVGRDFTGVIYTHLNLTENHLPEVRLIDPKGKKLRIPLDRYRFVIQKKGVPLKVALHQAKEKPETMHALIDSFFTLLKKRADAGIGNSDPNLLPNFGVLSGQAIEMDFGNYYPNIDPEKKKKEWKNFADRFDEWLRGNAPEYLTYFRAKREIGEKLPGSHSPV